MQVMNRQGARPMRVLYVIDGLTGGGAETSLVEILPDLRERDIELRIVTLLNDDNALGARVAAAGVGTRNLGGRSWAGRLRGLHDEIRRWSPDLIHTSLLWSDMLGRVAGAYSRLPVVTSLVNSIYGPEHLQNSKYGAWSVRAVHGADMASARMTTLFHAVSHQVKTVMSPRLRLRADRVSVVYRGRDADRLGRRSPERRAAVRDRLGIAHDAPVLLVVGRLDKQKAVDVSLRAAARLQRDLPELQVLVAGRAGNAEADVRAVAEEMPGVHLLGHRGDLADLLVAADCLSFPSRWEGLPGTLIEALALEVPLVASDIGPNREVLDGVDWPRVPVEDPSALARALGAVLADDPAVTRRRAQDGRARFENVFTTTRAADGMRELYARASELHGRG